jgi:hypothetical protein
MLGRNWVKQCYAKLESYKKSLGQQVVDYKGYTPLLDLSATEGKPAN